MSTHVKVINKGSGMPQVMLKNNWDNINVSNVTLAKTLEFICNCDEMGNAVQSDEVKVSVEEKLKAIITKNSNNDGKKSDTGPTGKNKSDNGGDKGKSKTEHKTKPGE